MIHSQRHIIQVGGTVQILDGKIKDRGTSILHTNKEHLQHNHKTTKSPLSKLP
ncbi:hypothetical protein AHAS_Ahas14G0165700 [Arachis hypogaea]